MKFISKLKTLLFFVLAFSSLNIASAADMYSDFDVPRTYTISNEQFEGNGGSTPADNSLNTSLQNIETRNFPQPDYMFKFSEPTYKHNADLINGQQCNGWFNCFKEKVNGLVVKIGDLANRAYESNGLVRFALDHPWTPAIAAGVVIGVVVTGWVLAGSSLKVLTSMSATKALSVAMSGYSVAAASVMKWGSKLFKYVKKIKLPPLTTKINRITKFSKALRGLADELVKWGKNPLMKAAGSVMNAFGRSRIDILAPAIIASLLSWAGLNTVNNPPQIIPPVVDFGKPTPPKSIPIPPKAPTGGITTTTNLNDKLKASEDKNKELAAQIAAVTAKIKESEKAAAAAQSESEKQTAEAAKKTAQAEKDKLQADQKIAKAEFDKLEAEHKLAIAKTDSGTKTAAATTVAAKAKEAVATAVKATTAAAKKTASAVKSATAKTASAATTQVTKPFNAALHDTETNKTYGWVWLGISAILFTYVGYQVYLRIKAKQLSQVASEE